MKYLLIMTTILFFALSSNAQGNEEDFESYLIERFDDVVIQQAKRYDVSVEVLRGVMLGYMYDDSDGKLKTFGYTLDRGTTASGTGWQIINLLAKKVKVYNDSKRSCGDNLECWRQTYFKKLVIAKVPTGLDKIFEDMDNPFKNVSTVGPTVIMGADGVRVVECKDGKCVMPEVNKVEPDSILNEAWGRMEPVELYYKQQIKIERGELNAIFAQLDMSLDAKNFEAAKIHKNRISDKIENIELYETKIKESFTSKESLKIPSETIATIQ